MKSRRNAPSTGIPLELGDFLCFAIYSAGHMFNRVYQPLLRELNLTYPQFIALVLLWGGDGQTVGELGEKLFLQSNTLTPMLKRRKPSAMSSEAGIPPMNAKSASTSPKQGGGYTCRRRTLYEASAMPPACRTGKSRRSRRRSTTCVKHSKVRIRGE